MRFKNSTVYTFYIMYQKYTFLVKLYICGLTYRYYIRYRHKLRIDVITYVSTRYRYYRTVVAVPVPPISGHQDIRSIGTAPVRSTSLWWWNLWDGIPGIPRWICGMGSLLGSAVVGSLLPALGRPRKFHRKVPRSQQESADDECGPAGVKSSQVVGLRTRVASD